MLEASSAATPLETEIQNPDTAAEFKFRGYMPGLDVLRGLAISFVLIHHGIESRMPWTMQQGWLRYWAYITSWGRSGVHLFFILSGFLITGILLDTRERRDYWSRFYRNRALRILPAYLLMLAVLKGTGVVSWRFVLAAMLYIANMAKLVGAQMNEYGSFWSLAVEEQFYLLWPLAVRRLRLHTLARLCVLIVAASPVLFLAAALRGMSFDIRYKLWGNACWLLCGALIAISLRTGWLTQSNIMKITRALAILSAALVPIAAYAELTSPPNSRVRQPSAENVLFFAIMPAYCAAVLYVVASNQKCKGLSTRGPIGNGFAFLGNISYGLYLVNWLSSRNAMPSWNKHPFALNFISPR